jgi:DNA-binding transcriptional MerR regulator
VDAAELDGELTIQQASRLLEVPAPTIRSWERRYGIAQANRSSGGHRRYTPEQVRMLRRMRDAIARGLGAVEAAALVKAAQLTSLEPDIHAFVSAAHELSPVGLNKVLDTAFATIGLDRTLDEVMFPAMQEIGREWSIGRCDVAYEHLATETTRAWLTALPVRHQPLGQPAAAPGLDQPIVLTCGPRDLHTLGLDSIGALLRQRRWDCRQLGASTPPSSLATAIEQLNAVAVVLVSHLAVGRHSAVQALRTARLSHTELFYAGNAFLTRQARHGVPGTYLGEHLSEAADLITTTVNARHDRGLEPA